MDDGEMRRTYDLPDRAARRVDDSGPTPPPDWQLWTSFFGAPVLWLLHFLLFYLAVERFCAVGGDESFGRWALAGATALAALAAAGLSLVAWRVGLRAKRSAVGYDDFLPQVGLITGLAAAFVLVLEGLPLLFVGICR